jgi:AraC-like DNA-binding protein
MRYQTYTPSHELAGFVDSYWTLEGHVGGGFEPVLPDGHCELVVHLGDPFERRLHGGRTERQNSCLFVGQMRQAVEVRPAGCCSVWGVRFRPDGAWLFTGLPQSEAAGWIGPASEVWGSRARHWEEQLRNAAGACERVRFTDAFLRAHLGRRTPDARLRLAVRMLLAAPTTSMDGAARATGWSRRQMERMFLQQVGLGPKTFARLARFQAAVQSHGRNAASWAEVAAACGYYDQAHLIADFREFGGHTPRELLASPEWSLDVTHFSNPRAGARS